LPVKPKTSLLPQFKLQPLAQLQKYEIIEVVAERLGAGLE
jgi:hypothetical protein